MRRIIFYFSVAAFFSGCRSTELYAPKVNDCIHLSSTASKEINIYFTDARKKNIYSTEILNALQTCFTSNYQAHILDAPPPADIPYWKIELTEYKAWSDKQYCYANTMINISYYPVSAPTRSMIINKTARTYVVNANAPLEAENMSFNEAVKAVVNMTSIIQ